MIEMISDACHDVIIQIIGLTLFIWL